MAAPGSVSADLAQGRELPLEEYRAVSLTAVAALGLGCASALALASPLLAVIPLAAIVAGVLALRGIAAAGGRLVGRSLAIVGICLAALFVGWGLAQHFSRQATVASQAIRVADGWLALVKRGELEAAHQLTLPHPRRAGSAKAVSELYRASPQLANDQAQFFAAEPLKSFIAAGKDVPWRLDSLVSQSRHGLEDEIVLKYVFERAGGGQAPMWIFVARSVEEKSHAADWVVQRVQHDPPQGISP
jgi:hypothetical protein